MTASTGSSMPRTGGCGTGSGPGFLPYQKGMFNHIDEMKDLGFEWNSRPGAKPRPTTPELRLADLDRDGLSAEIIYGCLMINDLIAEAPLRAWADKTYNDWVADFAKRSPTPTGCSRSRSSPTPTRSRPPPRSGAAPRWGCAAAISPSSA